VDYRTIANKATVSRRIPGHRAIADAHCRPAAAVGIPARPVSMSTRPTFH
jgi:hypothetical protein